MLLFLNNSGQPRKCSSERFGDRAKKLDDRPTETTKAGLENRAFVVVHGVVLNESLKTCSGGRGIAVAQDKISPPTAHVSERGWQGSPVKFFGQLKHLKISKHNSQ